MAARERSLSEARSAVIETTIAHSSPGRLRLKVDRATIESGAAQEAVAAFDEQSGVLSARLNVIARSIVVHFDERATDADALAEGVRRSGVTLSVAVAETPRSAAPRRTKFAAWVSQNTRSADERLLVASGGGVDLRTLLPVTLGILALREILAGRVGGAPWYTLAWWAFDSFLKVRASAPLPSPSRDPE
jgi:heavy-metal-associated domain-containing protein